MKNTISAYTVNLNTDLEVHGKTFIEGTLTILAYV